MNNTPLFRKFREAYLPLIKLPQSLLLLLTGLAGYMSARCPMLNIATLLAAAGSLFMAISGSTVLNMWYDRDIDARMVRTSGRPLAAGKLQPIKALLLGLILSLLGIGWSLWMDLLYGSIILTGIIFDVVVYTMWLKRRTAWSIVWGGIAGGMPVLAGRALGLGRIDWIGGALALAVLFWIPTHIFTFSIRCLADYQRAGIPTFPSRYGIQRTRTMISLSSMLAALVMGISSFGVGLAWGSLHLLSFLSAGLVIFALSSMISPSDRTTLGLYKYASVYMMGAMLLLVISGV
jgi:protoheme IX farnesyltransferase